MHCVCVEDLNLIVILLHLNYFCLSLSLSLSISLFISLSLSLSICLSLHTSTAHRYMLYNAHYYKTNITKPPLQIQSANNIMQHRPMHQQMGGPSATILTTNAPPMLHQWPPWLSAVLQELGSPNENCMDTRRTNEETGIHKAKSALESTARCCSVPNEDKRAGEHCAAEGSQVDQAVHFPWMCWPQHTDLHYLSLAFPTSNLFTLNAQEPSMMSPRPF